LRPESALKLIGSASKRPRIRLSDRTAEAVAAAGTKGTTAGVDRVTTQIEATACLRQRKLSGQEEHQGDCTVEGAGLSGHSRQD